MSWTHYRLLLRVEDHRAWEWYMAEAETQNLGTRALERQNHAAARNKKGTSGFLRDAFFKGYLKTRRYFPVT